MAEQRIVVIGASAGGIEALTAIVKRLPRALPAPFCVVLHLLAESPSILAHILSREGNVPAKQVEDGERLCDGVIYVAAPDHHLLLERNGTARSVRGPRENRHRPAIDPLFRSAAYFYGGGAIGIVLSGALDDGTAGLIAIKRLGGIAIVQDPHDAQHPSMPSSALAHVLVDHVLPAADIPSQIAAELSVPRKSIGTVDAVMKQETAMAKLDPHAMQEEERAGQPSAYSCPECSGVLWQIREGEFLRYRCRVGHAYSPESMLAAQDEELEDALWAAMKTLEENAQLAGRLAANERERGHEWMVKRFEEREKEARQRAEVIRKFLLRDLGPVSEEQIGHR